MQETLQAMLPRTLSVDKNSSCFNLQIPQFLIRILIFQRRQDETEKLKAEEQRYIINAKRSCLNYRNNNKQESNKGRKRAVSYTHLDVYKRQNIYY